jgi:hypothetical protein
LAKRNFDLTWSTPGSTVIEPAYLENATSTAATLSYLAGTDPDTFTAILNGFRQLFLTAVNEVQNLRPTPPSPPLALVQLWNEGRMDNFLCASSECFLGNKDYRKLRIEGYQPKAGSPDTVPLHYFWNAAISDIYATTKIDTPQGYSPAGLGDGIVYKTQQPNSVPLQLYWSAKRRDMLTVASAAGIQYANQNGYKLLNSTLGYVLSKSPEEQDFKNYYVTYTRWAYSMELLYNAFN